MGDVGKKSLLELLSVPEQNISGQNASEWKATVLSAIRNGADVSERGANGFTPLMFAALLNDDPEIVRALLDAGADVDAETHDGMTALMWALEAETHDPGGDLRSFLERERRRVETAALIVESGASVSAVCYSSRRMKWTPLFFAVMEPDRNAALISALIAAGAGVNARTTDDLTPLFFAAALGSSSDVVHGLIRAGADVNAAGKQEGREGWTPLLYALCGPRKSLPIVEELLKNGADANVAVGGGWTPLLFAAVIGDTPGYAHALLEAGADVNTVDDEGNSALDCALARNCGNVARRLLRAGAKRQRPERGERQSRF
ncbi:MAG: ankyrin repeat domain-containing protein [Synergistaceae bacterium]|nr:ankyrin repeat domain-containing protein [Synergistaceae bacterium]